MANDSASGPMRYEVSDLLFGTGWVSYSVADLVSSQASADALNGIAVAFMGASAGMAWQAGRRWRSALFGALAVARALLGSPPVAPNSMFHITITWTMIGLWAAMLLFIFTRRPRHDASAAPIAG